MSGGTPIWKQAVLSLLAFVMGLAAGMFVLSLTTDLGGAHAFLDAIAPFVAATLAGVLLGLLPTAYPAWVTAVGYLLPFGLICLLDHEGSIPIGQIVVLLVLPLFTLAGAMAWRVVPQLLGPSPWRGPAQEPRCPQCGYILYHAERQRCPECGRPFKLHEVDMRLARLDGETLRPRESGQAGSSCSVQPSTATPEDDKVRRDGTPGVQ